MNIVENITKRLKEQGKTQRQFYNDLELPNNMLSIWKKRNSIPNAVIMYNIALYLNCRIEDLIDREYL